MNKPGMEKAPDGEIMFLMPATMSDLEHLAAFREVFEKFKERNAYYQDLWQEETLEGLASLIRHKLMRVAQLQGENQLDDAVDLVNYAMFMLRKVQDAR